MMASREIKSITEDLFAEFQFKAAGMTALVGTCVEWKGKRDRRGYGVTYLGGRGGFRVHRVAYTIAKGPIPEGLVIDHLCRNTACVNPDHLEAVTNRENVVRGIGPTAINAVATHCHRGHEFTEANTYVMANGWRRCRKCQADAQRPRNTRRDQAKALAKLHANFAEIDQ